ncbi:phage terminase large subunit family protein [Massilia sp. DJPM01]|uniref:phage terminase large subunit family protein n=1 Tax=Massilia sp. DJPM01 TaxID=3024404 RepID=UPI00259DDBAA|nr:phage terminase large subunit family protein [Massilia sp. DJPM01]MDM5178505.1 phage terminase large subunit family protein [Massilia sp. DJPM01]
MTTATFSNPDAVAAALRRASSNMVPPPDMLPSDWAQEHVKIPVGNAIPGPISFDNAPYQRGMLDVIKEPGIRRISYKTGAQLGKTTVQQCITGYFIAHDPRSQIFVQPTQGDVQTFLETKLRPMLDANPIISSKMAKQRGREGVNNSRIISYIGGWLMFGWAGSPKTLRSRSAPITQADEIDGMQATCEGDPIELLAQRAATFGDQAIRTESSTPTILGASRIDTSYTEGDQRRYYVPCPHCAHPQYFRWEQVRWEGRGSVGVKDFEEDINKNHLPETALYLCEADDCGTLWDDGQRIAAVRNAERNGHGWKASKPFRGHASFHAPEMLSTFRRLRDIVQSYLDKIALGDMQSFVNVSLGDAYEETGEKADPNSLQARAVEYSHEVPAGGLVLTAGVDAQQDRLECEVVAWGVGEQSWSVGYYILWGDTLAQEVWDDLDELLATTYEHASGAALPISATILDTGGTGGYTQRAYEYVRARTSRKVFAGKGVAGWGRGIVESPQRKQSGKTARKVNLFLVGVDEAKLVVMRRLAVATPGPGYCHFPVDREAEYYKQLTAEKMVTRYIKGQPVREWHKPDKARNEALDCRVYALAALKVINPAFKRLAERYGVKIDVILPGKPTMTSEEPEEVAEKLANNGGEMAEKIKAARPENPPEEPKPTVIQNATVRNATQRKGPKRRNFATTW